MTTVELRRHLVTALLLSDHPVVAARPARVVDTSLALTRGGPSVTVS